MGLGETLFILIQKLILIQILTFQIFKFHNDINCLSIKQEIHFTR